MLRNRACHLRHWLAFSALECWLVSACATVLYCVSQPSQVTVASGSLHFNLFCSIRLSCMFITREVEMPTVVSSYRLFSPWWKYKIHFNYVVKYVPLKCLCPKCKVFHQHLHNLHIPITILFHWRCFLLIFLVSKQFWLHSFTFSVWIFIQIMI